MCIQISRILKRKANTLTLQQSELHLALGGEMKQGNSMLMNCKERVNKWLIIYCIIIISAVLSRDPL